MVLAAETRKYCNEYWFLNQNRPRIAISLSKTALEARPGALQGDTRCLSAIGQIPAKSAASPKRGNWAHLRAKCPQKNGSTTNFQFKTPSSNLTAASGRRSTARGQVFALVGCYTPSHDSGCKRGTQAHGGLKLQRMPVLET